MRILHITHQYPPDKVGGVELHTKAISQALTERGHAVAVFYRRNVPGHGISHHTEDGVDIYAAWDGMAGPARRFLLTFGGGFLHKAYLQALSEFQPDLVHIQHLLGLPINIISSIRQCGIPFVITLHDFWWVCANAQLLTNYGRQICSGPRLWLNCGHCVLARAGAGAFWPTAPLLIPLLAERARRLRAVLANANVLIAPTAFVGEWYAAHGVPPERIRVLPHGIESPEPFVRSSHLERPVRFACIGGLSWQKGVHVVINAFNQLIGNAELWIAGESAADQAYAASLRLAANHRVRFLGRLSRQQVWECLAQVDALLVPSLWYEAFSLITHEAFAAGVPVIASRLGALAEVVHDGIDGLLVPPGDVDVWRDVLQQLIDDPTHLVMLSKGIRRPLSLTQHVGRLIEIYEQVLARTG